MTRTTLRIPRHVLEAILDEARREHPREACGLLLGFPGEGGRVVRALSCPNAAGSEATRRFLLDPPDFLRAAREAESTGQEIVGTYHSHPAGPPEPSAADREEAEPGWMHLVVGPGEGGRIEARGFTVATSKGRRSVREIAIAPGS